MLIIHKRNSRDLNKNCFLVFLQSSEISMALYFSVQEQNELADNIWLNTNAGSDYIAQSVNEFRLVKTLKQSKMNLWMKLICITFCFLLILLFILIFILILNQK